MIGRYIRIQGRRAVLVLYFASALLDVCFDLWEQDIETRGQFRRLDKLYDGLLSKVKRGAS